MTLEEEYLREITKAVRKGKEDGLALGLEKGIAEGLEKGAADMQERLNKLNLRLMELGRVDDLQRSFTDAAYQQQLLEEFGI